jgi:hypothetical protein
MFLNLELQERAAGRVIDLKSEQPVVSEQARPQAPKLLVPPVKIAASEAGAIKQAPAFSSVRSYFGRKWRTCAQQQSRRLNARRPRRHHCNPKRARGAVPQEQQHEATQAVKACVTGHGIEKRKLLSPRASRSDRMGAWRCVSSPQAHLTSASLPKRNHPLMETTTKLLSLCAGKVCTRPPSVSLVIAR